MSTDTIPQLTPMHRWESEPADPTILAEGIRFPYACNIVTSNRFIKTSLSEHLATFDKNDMSKSGIPTEELINLYRKFAEGGFGIIVTGCIMVNGKELEAAGNVIIDKDFDMDARREAFKRWVTAGKANGSLMIAQLFHPGKNAIDIPQRSKTDINAFTHEDIRELVEQYAYAAKFVQECGFDGVEICSSYYYTLGQFLTDGSNLRTDEYGGSLENRSRLLFTILHKLRMRLPRQDNFVFGVKLYPGNFEPGYVEEDFDDFVHNLEKTGFDYIAFTDHYFNLPKLMDKHAKKEHFYQTIIPEAKKKLTRTKLILTGNIVTLSEMCEAVQKRWTAGIALGKAISYEPDLPKKLINGEVTGAVKSLIDPGNYRDWQQAAGTQLWQHANNLEILDTSNPAQIEAFYDCLAKFKESQFKEQKPDKRQIIYYPKMLIKGGEYKTLSEAPQVGMEPEKFEEEVHEVAEKDLNTAVSPIGMHKQTIADSFKSFERRFEDDGNTEITEESFEKVTTSNTDFVEPKDHHEKHPHEGHSNLFTQAAKKAEVLAESFQAGIEGLTEKITGKDTDKDKPEQTEIAVVETTETPQEAELTGIVPKMEQSAEKIYEDMKDVVEEVKLTEKECMEIAKETGKDYIETGKDYIEMAKETGKDYIEAALGKGKDYVDAGKDYIEAAKDAGSNYIDGVKKTCNDLAGNLVKPGKSEEEPREIIAGITSDNKEIITGLLDNKDENDTAVTIPFNEHEVDGKECSPEQIQKSTIVSLHATNEPHSSEVADEPKANGDAVPQAVSSSVKQEKKRDIATVAAEIAEDIEERIQKVILHNISLGGLISDPLKKAELAKDKQEIVAGVTGDNQKIISGLSDDNDTAAIPEPFVISTKFGSSQVPVDRSESIKQAEHNVDDRFNDVKQWLVFKREQSAPAGISDEIEVQKVHSSPLGIDDTDEYRNVKQWLMFTKEPPAASSESATSECQQQQQQTDEVPMTIEDQFKHVKQWLVFNRDDAPSETVAAPDESIHTLATESLPQLETHSISQSLEIKSDPLHGDEFYVAEGSPTTHKQMFGSSLRDGKGGKEILEGTSETVVTHEVFEDAGDTLKKDDEKKSGGISGFFKSAFTNPVQKLFNDTKDKVEKVEEQIATATDEFFDTNEPVQSDHNETNVLNAGDDSSLQEIISEKLITTEPEGTVIEEVKETVKTSGQPGTGQESTSTVTTTTTKRTQKKRSSKSSKTKKGSFEDHGFDFI